MMEVNVDNAMFQKDCLFITYMHICVFSPLAAGGSNTVNNV